MTIILELAICTFASLTITPQLLLAIATIGMGVRLASALASGFLVCIVTDIQTNPPNAAIETPIWLDKLSGPYAGTLAAYAAQDSDCHNQASFKNCISVNFYHSSIPT